MRRLSGRALHACSTGKSPLHQPNALTVATASHAVSPELHLDAGMRARGGWRGELACQRGHKAYGLAMRLIQEAARLTESIKTQPDSLDSRCRATGWWAAVTLPLPTRSLPYDRWMAAERDGLLRRFLTGRKEHSPRLGIVDAEALCTLATACADVLRQQPTVVRVPAPCKVFGDVHGQLRSLLLLFASFGFPSHLAGDVQGVRCTFMLTRGCARHPFKQARRYQVSYIFNGDFVDRGVHQLEVVALLFALKLVYPERIYLLRGKPSTSIAASVRVAPNFVVVSTGNHEFRDMNEKMRLEGFRYHCATRFAYMPSTVWMRTYEYIHDAFDLLPLAAQLGWRRGMRRRYRVALRLRVDRRDSAARCLWCMAASATAAGTPPASGRSRGCEQRLFMRRGVNRTLTIWRVSRGRSRRSRWRRGSVHRFKSAGCFPKATLWRLPAHKRGVIAVGAPLSTRCGATRATRTQSCAAASTRPFEASACERVA